MAGAVELAVAYVSIVAEASGIRGSVRKEMAGVGAEGRAAGTAAGREFSAGFNATTNLEDAKAKVTAANGAATRASAAYSDALAREKDTAFTLSAAEARLGELRDSGAAKTSQIIRAEQGLERARTAHTKAQQAAATAYDVEFVAAGKAAAATADLERAQSRAATTSERSSGVMARFGKAFSEKIRAASKDTEGLTEKISAANSGVNTLASTVLKVGFGSQALLSLTSHASGLVASLAPIAGLGAAIPGAFAAVQAGVLTLKVATAGFGDALKAGMKSEEDFEKATANMPPAMKASATAVVEVMKASSNVMKNIQESFWKGLDDVIVKVATGVLPRAATAMLSTTVALNGLAKAAGDAVVAMAGTGVIEKTFAATNRVVQALTPALKPLAVGLGTLVGASADLIQPMGGAAAAAQKFQTWAARVSSDGSLARWFQAGASTAGELWRVLKNAGRILFEVGKAAAAAGGSLGVSGLADGLGRFADVVARPEIQTALTQAFTRANAIMAVTFDIFIKVLPLIIQFAPALMAASMAWKAFAAAAALVNGAQMLAQAGKVVLGWVGVGTAASTSAATTTVAAGVQQRSWIQMAATATANAARMAASWVVAMGPIGWVITGLVALGAGLVVLYKKNETFRNFVNGAWAKIQEVVGGALKAIGDGIVGVGGWLDGAGRRFTEFLGVVQNWGRSAALAVTVFAVSALGAFRSWLGDVGRVLSGVGAVIVGAFRAVGGDQLTSALAPALANFGSAVNERLDQALASMRGFGEDVNGVLDGVASAVNTKVLPVMSGFGQTVNNFLSSAAGAVQTWVTGTVAPAFARFGADVKSALDTAAGAVAGFAGSVAQWFGANIGAPIKAFTDGVVEWFGGVFRIWGQWGTAIGSVVSQTVSSFASAAGSVLAGLGQFVLGVGAVLGTNLRNIATTAFEGIKGVFNGFVGFISGIFNALAGAIRGNWQAAWNGVKQATSGLVGAVVGVVQIAFSPLIGVVKTVVDGAAGAFSGFGTKAIASFAQAGAAISGWWNVTVAPILGLVKTWLVTHIGGALALLRVAWAAAWAGAGAAVSTAWAAIVSTLGAIRTWFTVTLPQAFGGLKTSLAAAWSGMWAAVSAGWASITATVFGPIRTWFTVTLPQAAATMKTGVATWFTNMTAAVSATLSGFGTSVLGPIKTWFTVTLPQAAASMKALVTGWFTQMVTAISAALSGFGAAVLTPIKTWFTVTLPGAASTMKTLVTSWWSQMVAAVSAVLTTLKTSVLTPLSTWFKTTLPQAAASMKALVAGWWTQLTTALTTTLSTLSTKVLTPLKTWFTTTLPGAADSLRRLVSTHWASLGKSVTTTFDTLRTKVLSVLNGWFKTTLPNAADTLRRIVSQKWADLYNSVSTTFGTLRNKVLTPVNGWFKTTLPNAADTMRKVVSQKWSDMYTWIGGIFKSLGERILTPIKTWFTSTLPGAGKTMSDRVSSWWSSMYRSLYGVWKDSISPMLGRFKSVITKDLPGWFESAKKAVARLWEGIKSVVAAPIKYVVNSVIRDKLVYAWNAVAGKLKLPTFNFGGWRVGGWTGPGGEHDPAGIVHADEYVIRKRSRRKIEREHPGLLDRMNTTGDVSITPRGQRPGVVFDSERPGPRMGGRTSPIRGKAPADQGVWRQLKSWVMSNLPGARVTSAYRRTMTATGRVSNHARGLAVDIAGPNMMGYFNKILATYGRNSLELIHSPAGGRQIHRGRPHMYTGVTRANHWDHVHWAMASMDKSIPAWAGADGVSMPNWAAVAAHNLVNPLFKGARSLVDGIMGKFGDSAWVEIAKAGGKLPIDQVDQWLNAKIDQVFPPIGGGVADAANFARVASGPVVEMVKKLAGQQGWGSGAQWNALQWIVNRESGFNPGAQNKSSTAFGLFQFLNSTWRSVGMSKSSDPQTQTIAGLKYILQRYKDPIRAMAYWKAHGHYSQGGRVAPLPKLYDQGGMLRKGDLAFHAASRPDRVLTERQWQAVERYLPVQQASTVTDPRKAGLEGGVHIHGDVYGDPNAYAAAIERRRRDQMALISAAGLGA